MVVVSCTSRSVIATSSLAGPEGGGHTITEIVAIRTRRRLAFHGAVGKKMVEGEGFEPSKAEPSDLQSDPVDRLGIPPTRNREF